jgi:hypothetical protein
MAIQVMSWVKGLWIKFSGKIKLFSAVFMKLQSKYSANVSNVLKLDTNIFCCLMRVVVVILHKSIRGGLN